MKRKRMCFVIMGFGKKTDFASGRTLDLDMTYKNIIKPAVIEAGFECVRADEIQDSGLIDKSMYALLMQSDLVIADISTYNPNAIYELGVRHAVRPFSTIIMKEEKGKIPFDIDHSRIFQYTHLEDDIGASEAERCQKALISLIKELSKNESTDSPLYEYIKGINPPTIPKAEYNAIITDLAEREKHIFALVERAKELMEENNFSDAAKIWDKASEKVENEPYFIQQKSLCIYKSKLPSEKTALMDALAVISELEPDGSTTDPETLGITGAIYKRLWFLDKDVEQLKRAINYYGKCFKIREDYYTGENYAQCLEFMSKEESTDDEEKIYFKIEAKRTREKIISNLEDNLLEENFDSRVDKKWIYGTLANCNLSLSNGKDASKYEKLFMDESPLDWEIETYEESKKQINNLKNI